MRTKISLKLCCIIVCTVLFLQLAKAQNNTTTKMPLTGELALLPPMGWNSWNAFGTNLDESALKAVVDAYVASGMRDAGYKYFSLDDTWSTMERDSNGNLVADPKKFPHGMKALADYVHSKGLKFGIYNCAGWRTCAGYPGSRGHEYQDALLYASWGVDLLKYDWCNTDSLNTEEAYKTMSRALRATGRPIVFSICEWGSHKPWLWPNGIGEQYRTTGDIGPGFVVGKKFGDWQGQGVLQILDAQMLIRKYNRPNHWNDPDMLEVGNGMTYNEDKSHFSLWCMLAAPLITGNDLRKMSDQTKTILTNKDAIAIDQDTLGISAFKVPLADSLELYVKPMKDAGLALCFLNRTATAKKIDLKWSNLIVSDDVSGITVKFAETAFRTHNIWTKKNGSTKGTFKQDIGAHDVIVLRLTKL